MIEGFLGKVSWCAVSEFLKEKDQNPQTYVCFKEAFPGISDLALVAGQFYVELRFTNSRNMSNVKLIIIVITLVLFFTLENYYQWRMERTEG